MNWVSDDSDHTGSLQPLVGDRVLMEVDEFGGRLYGDLGASYSVVPFSEVTGWVVWCDCEDGRRAGWTGLSWTRVATPGEEDAAAGRLYVADGDVTGVFYARPEVAIVAEAVWRRHAVPLAAYDQLKLAATSVLYAEAEAGLGQHDPDDQPAYDQLRLAASVVQSADAKLDQAVGEARRAGLSWTEVGRATGMRRQSAHERWGRREVTPG